MLLVGTIFIGIGEIIFIDDGIKIGFLKFGLIYYLF